ncbi:hypothetical protein BH20ACI3_BH20ACI3_33390 [soil metagenome]
MWWPLVSFIFSRRFFPGEDPIGRRIKVGEWIPNPPYSTIVGVVANHIQQWSNDALLEIGNDAQP